MKEKNSHVPSQGWDAADGSDSPVVRQRDGSSPSAVPVSARAGREGCFWSPGSAFVPAVIQGMNLLPLSLPKEGA